MGEVTPIDRWLERKLEAIACYQSQIPTLFGDEARMRASVAEYTRLRGGEREWLVREAKGPDGRLARRGG
jgi:hypothetical protein